MDAAEAIGLEPIRDLIAREQIRDVIARYNHAGDRGRLDELVACFTEDGVMQLADVPELRGREAIRGYLEGVARDLAAATTGPAPGSRGVGMTRATLRHHVASSLIELTDADAANASSYFSVYTEVGLDHWGSYRDRLARVGEAWLLSQRRVRVDGATPSSRMAVRYRVAGTTP